MGLDMNLHGEVFYFGDCPEVDGFNVDKMVLDIGYWRKHPNLHGYIVQTFAKGIDECQKIELSVDDLDNILKAVIEDRLPHTEGFFFGTSREEDKKPTISILSKAIVWLSKPTNKDQMKSVYYQASW